MGTELALHLLANHEVTVWNRTMDKTQRLVDAGASAAESAADAVDGAELVVTSLFGPQTVCDVVIEPQLIPAGIPWMDTTTVSPADADAFAAAVPTYIATPVVGTLGPARNGKLGVYVGTPDEKLRDLAQKIAAPWADPQRLRGVDTAAKAATGKLLANLALAVSAQGLREALALGTALDVTPEEVLDMLDSTGLAFIAGMKGPFVRGERDTEGGDFTVDALAKDAHLMLDAVPDPDRLPAVAAALASFEEQQEQGRGDHDFSAAIVRGPRGS